MRSRSIYITLFALLLPGLLKAQVTEMKGQLRNVLRISPATVFYGGTGGGLSYERFLDDDRKVSVMLPVSFGLRRYMIGSTSVPAQGDDLNYSFMFNPGIRMYPKGQRRVSYAIGASVFVTRGSENGFTQESNGAYNAYAESTEMRVGSLISNNLTVNISKRVNIGLEALIGCSFYSRIHNNTTSVTQREAVSQMTGIMLQVGYRF